MPGAVVFYWSREQGAWSREHGAGSREHGAGSREQGAWSREQGAGSMEQGAAGERELTTETRGYGGMAGKDARGERFFQAGA